MTENTCFLDLCSGIGGFALAAYWAGLRFDGHYFSEVDKYAIDIFQKRFPEAIPLGDVREIDYGKLPKGEWVIAGGPPCQPFSLQGRRLQEKDRRNMWPEAIKAVRELRPHIAVFENVYGVLDYLDEYILPAIESEGYKTETVCIPAYAFGADHKRERWWVIAYTGSNGLSRLPVQQKLYCQERFKKTSFESLSVCNRAGGLGTFPRIQGEDNGIPDRVDRLKCLGNAIVPQCAELIFNLPVFDKWRKTGVLDDR
jgi:DNA (cytosine-5)-methyltransferase 1